MIILRQKEFSGHSISWQQGLDATTPGIIVDNGKKLDPKGNWDDKYLSDSFHIKLNQEMIKREESNKHRKLDDKPGKDHGHVYKTTDGYLIYPDTNYYGDHRDDCGRSVTRRSASNPEKSYKESYRDFLRNEREISKLSGFKDDPSKIRVASGYGYDKKITNEDIKNDIRKIARKEGIKKWTKKWAKIIGGGALGTVAVGTGAYLLHKHNKKKKQEEAKKRIIGEKTDKDVKGTEAEEKVNKILDKSEKEMREVNFSKTSREVVPGDIVKKVKDGGGVIQKDHNGDWRIISMKTNTNKSRKPEFWPQKGSTKAEMKKILQAYQSNQH